AALDVTGAVSAANVTLADSAGGAALTVSGSIAGSDTVSLTASTGALALNGVITAATLDLNAAAGISQGGGSLAVGTLLSSTGVTGDVLLTRDSNRIATLDAFTVTGGSLSLTDAGPLTIASAGTIPAQVAADDFTLVMVGAGASGNVAISGAIVVPGTLSVTTNGTIQRSGGDFIVGTLTGSAVTLADFGTGAMLSTLGQFTVTGSEFMLGNAQPLTIIGPLSAEFFRITATGSMTLAGDITTLGETRAQQGLADIKYAGSDAALNNPLPDRGSYLAVLADGDAPATFTQATPVTISTAGGDVSTLRIQLLSNGGTITLGDLTAPSTDLLLFPGGNGDVVGTGHVNLYGLLVAGRGGKSDLSGIIATVDGAGAAHLATITPLPDPSYRFNACPIGSVNCVLMPVNVLPPINPLRNFFIGETRGDEDDLDLILPNVADEDY
ncbi:MAG TPA: hypothetical protein VL154_18540, partial [Acetobacteraceae bacterium]|nr:hypothetical protein [Acetobacteraceae bacterium]